jgi:two-component system response regulator MtrA
MSKLLIVDDDINITKIYARVAHQLGFEVQVINNPLLATEAFLAFTPDVVMLDMVMPEKDGAEVLHEILASGAPARIIVSSGYGDAILRLSTGVDALHGGDRVSVLRKPVRNAELKQVLMEAQAG